MDQWPTISLDVGLNRLDLDFLQHVDALQCVEVAKKGALQIQIFGQSCQLAGLGVGGGGQFSGIKDDACVRNTIPYLHHSRINQ